MRRVEAIRTAPLFCTCVERIEAAEADREFCRHGMPHLLDVARIAWIGNLEHGLGLDREVVYAAALLHDIGRAEQYATGEDHDAAGARMAGEILDGVPEGLRFDAGERAMIIGAVAGHRGACGDADPCDGVRAGAGPAEDARIGVLSALIKAADGKSRACFACPARDACYWTDERKNLSLDI